MSATTWIVLLRGINVGGHKRVAMSDLRGLLESLGYHDVRTHLQSGNALFTASGVKATRLEHDIASAIESQLGLDVIVLVRSAAELRRVVADNPYLGRGIEQKQLHATFLSKQPAATKVAQLDREAFRPDDFVIGDRVIYARLPNGVAGSRLPDWERTLDVSASTRNWNTVARLLALTPP
jgi:uncharacterized protein (DUF1697 family)